MARPPIEDSSLLRLTSVAAGTFLGPPGLACAGHLGHNQFMTIKYPNGAVCKAIILSHEEHEIRAIEAGSDDVQIYTRVKGLWFSERIDPVSIRFDWQDVTATAAPSVEDCICSKELATHLIQTLFAGCEGGKATEETLVFNALVNSGDESPLRTGIGG
jgi:hypothetical protein